MSTSFKILNSINEAVDIVKEPSDVQQKPRFIETFKSVGDYGKMIFNKLTLSGFELWISEYKMNYETVFFAEVPDQILEAHITLKNRMVQSLGCKRNTILDEREFNVTYAPNMQNRTLFPVGGEYTTFDIHPTESVLKNWAEDFPVLQKFINRKEQHSSETLQLLGQRSFLDLEMLGVVNRILQYRFVPDCSKMLTEALSSELLAMFLMRSQNNKLPKLRNHNKNIEALLYVREIIEHEAESYDSEDLFSTEIQLADEAGLTLFQLKSGFKRLFGVNPYKMSLGLRLHKAQKMLRDTSLSVFDIALCTGFQTSEGLIRAYKKMFGITPSMERIRLCS